MQSKKKLKTQKAVVKGMVVTVQAASLGRES